MVKHPPSDELVLEAAERFRAALGNIDRRLWTRLGIDRFPRGACGHACELLGRYLYEEIGIEAEYVLCDFHTADNEWVGGHAWLEWTGLIIDITGDQFGWPPVIVSRKSSYHAAGRPNLRQDGPFWAPQCPMVWSAAMEYLKMDGRAEGV